MQVANVSINYFQPLNNINFKKFNQLSFLGANKTYLLAFDLDGTFLEGIKDGKDEFLKLAAQKNHKLAYVSGRLSSELDTIRKEYGIPMPDYYLSSNGQHIYTVENGKLIPDETWHSKMVNTGFTRPVVKKVMQNFIDNNKIDSKPPLFQFDHRKTEFNLEFFVNHKTKKTIVQKVSNHLKQNGIKARVIIDYVPPANVAKSLPKLPKHLQDNIKPMLDPKGGGYVMILTAANKADSVLYLADKLNIDKNHVITAGNAGNDRSLAGKGFWFIVVGNAEKILKKYIDKLAPELQQKVFKATKDGIAGIIEGLTNIYSIVGFR